MQEPHLISNNKLQLNDIAAITSLGKPLVLANSAIEKIQKCRAYLDAKTQQSDTPLYGINTGFGALYNIKINDADLGTLQENLVKSHACGMGAKVPVEIVKLMLLLKAQSLSYGHSGTQLVTVQRLLDFYNNDIIPVIYEQGSLGASGDLAPLAHLSLPLLGLGEVYYQGQEMPASQALAAANLSPIALQSKEGLALLNGTQFMAAYGVHCVLRANKLLLWADVIGALSLDAFDGKLEPFEDLVHLIRHHKGQLKTAQNIRHILQGSSLITQPKVHVQDPYSFRCMPQVHGASKDTVDYVNYVFTNEINSVTDNPTIFPDEDRIISAGNFHGQPLAIALDSLAIAMAEIANISERRTYQLVSGSRGLPVFLVNDPGLNSGFMIPQYTAASIVSQNKQYATPASVDSIESSNGQEDHVSMGANAATKALKVIDNVETVLAIELYNAAQALEFRRPAKTSPVLETLLEAYRQKVAFVQQDKIMHYDIVQSVDFVKHYHVERLF